MTAAKRVSRAIRKRAVGYVRVSSVRGREGDSFLSPDTQREKIEAWAEYRGYEIVRFYVDLDESGRTMKRPQFEQMMRDAATGSFDAVAVYRLTRFREEHEGRCDRTRRTARARRRSRERHRGSRHDDGGRQVDAEHLVRDG
jgi:hypothetical protein